MFEINSQQIEDVSLGVVGLIDLEAVSTAFFEIDSMAEQQIQEHILRSNIESLQRFRFYHNTSTINRALMEVYFKHVIQCPELYDIWHGHSTMTLGSIGLSLGQITEINNRLVGFVIQFEKQQESPNKEFIHTLRKLFYLYLYGLSQRSERSFAISLYSRLESLLTGRSFKAVMEAVMEEVMEVTDVGLNFSQQRDVEQQAALEREESALNPLQKLCHQLAIRCEEIVVEPNSPFNYQAFMLAIKGYFRLALRDRDEAELAVCMLEGRNQSTGEFGNLEYACAIASNVDDFLRQLQRGFVLPFKEGVVDCCLENIQVITPSLGDQDISSLTALSVNLGEHNRHIASLRTIFSHTRHIASEIINNLQSRGLIQEGGVIDEVLSAVYHSIFGARGLSISAKRLAFRMSFEDSTPEQSMIPLFFVSEKDTIILNRARYEALKVLEMLSRGESKQLLIDVLAPLRASYNNRASELYMKAIAEMKVSFLNYELPATATVEELRLSVSYWLERGASNIDRARENVEACRSLGLEWLATELLYFIEETHRAALYWHRTLSIILEVDDAAPETELAQSNHITFLSIVGLHAFAVNFFALWRVTSLLNEAASEVGYTGPLDSLMRALLQIDFVNVHNDSSKS